MAVKIRKSAVLQSLSLTPLIDVVFLLLIFFLVASRFADEERELNVKLPSASDARPMVLKPKDLELSINSEGDYYIDSQGPLTFEKLTELLSSAAASNPLSQTVVIRADRSCQWNDVAQAMSACQQAGLKDVKTSVAQR